MMMSTTLIDSYIKALSELEEKAFQRAIVQRLLVALNNFQSVPASPQGDGALDGYSHNGANGYCCYGLTYDAAKTPKQRSKQLVNKFSSDLQRIFELIPKGKNFQHKDNEALMRVFGALPAAPDRIGHLTLITNWFESHEPLGAIRQNAIKLAGASLCRWIRPDAIIVLKGPKEFADQYGVDETTMLWLKHQDLWEHLDQKAAVVDVPEGPSFDSKMQTAERILPDDQEEVRELASLLRSDWQRAIAFEGYLSDRLPSLHSALERGRRRLLARVLMESHVHPWDSIRGSRDLAEEVFSDDFLESYGSGMVKDLALGEVARLVGACRINWNKPPNAKQQ
jgi:hypothetical protein